MPNFITLSNRIINSTVIGELDSILPNNLSKRLMSSFQHNKISELLGLDNLIKNILIFNVGPTSEGPIHIDINNLEIAQIPSTFALNIPIAHCDELSVMWYITDKSVLDAPDDTIPEFPGTPILEKKYAIEFDTTDCTLPHIVKIDTWHSVTNYSKSNIAKLISIRFFEDLITKDELVKRFL